MYETKICDIHDLQKCLTQTCVDSEQNVIKAAIDQWREHLRSCVRAGSGHFECCEIIVYLWSPYVIGQTIYIFMLWFVLSLIHI